MKDSHRPPSAKRRCDYERTSISIEEVVALLNGIEQHREALAHADAVLSDWLCNSPQFGQAWHDFAAAGGISANDFYAFMDGRFRGRPGVRQLGHLRLIANDAAPSIARRAITHQEDDGGDPEAA